MFLLNWANPDLFFIYFRLFKHTSLQFLQQINVKNVLSIQYTMPGFELTTFEHESPPITTRPGLLPSYNLFDNMFLFKIVSTFCD